MDNIDANNPNAVTCSSGSEPLSWSIAVGPEIRVGDIVRVTGPHWEKRKWWQLWKPKWTEHPLETKVYRVGKLIPNE